MGAVYPLVMAVMAAGVVLSIAALAASFKARTRHPAGDRMARFRAGWLGALASSPLA